MNKFFAKLAGALSLVALVAGAGVAVASGVNVKGVKAAEAVYAEAIFIAGNQPGNSSYTSSFENTTSDFVWTVTNFNNNNNGWSGAIKCGRKNNASVATITTKSTVSEAITKASINITALTASKVNSIKLYADSSVVGTFTVGTGTKEVEIPVASRGANKVYKFEFDCASGSSNGLVTIDSVKLYYDAATGNPEISLSPNQLSFLSNGASQNVTVTPNDKFTGTPTISVSGAPSYVNCSVSGLTISVSPKAVGTETITINAVHNTEQASATLTVEVLDKHGRVADDPFTVAEVTALIDEDTSKTHSGIYVAGIVSQVDEYKEAYHSITYWISDDGTTTGQFECYSGKGIGSADFSSINDVEVGAQVEVCGTAKYFSSKSIHEFDINNYLISYKGPTTSPLDSISLDTSSVQKTFDVGDAFNHDNLVVTAHYEDETSKTVSPTSVSAPDMSSAGEKTVTVSYTENEVTKTADYSITVNAVVLHTISFYSGDGTGSMDPVQVKEGADYTLPACTFTAPSGKVFDYWDVDGEQKTVIENVDDDYDVTAMWKDAPSEVADTLDAEIIGVSGTTYNSWTDKSVSSSAVYAGNSSSPTSGTTANSIQLRSGTSKDSSIHSGIISTTSGGTLIKVEVVWNAGCTAGRVIDVYGKDTAYTSADDLYDSETQGTKLGSITQGSTTELTGFDECTYVGIRSNNGALNIDSVTFTWTGTPTPPEPKVLSSISISNEKTEYEVGDQFVMPTVTAHYEGAPDSDVTSKATQSGFDSSAAATGQEVTISYTEGGVTKDASYFVNINAPEPVETKTYKKVKTTLADYSGNYLIVYDEGKVAFDGSLETLDAVSNNQAVTIENEKIELSSEYRFSISKTTTAYSLRAAQGKYIGQTSDSNGLVASDDALDNAITFNGTSTDVVSSGAHLRFNSASNQDRFRYYKSSSYTGQKAIDLYIEVADDGEALMLDLLNMTYGVCTAGGEHIKADFETAWSNLKTAYNTISDEAVLNKLATTDGNAKGTMFYEALARYDLLVGKYGLDNFISGRVVSGLGSTSVISNGSVDNNSAMIIITVIALTSISSIAVLLVIKRRKAIR